MTKIQNRNYGLDLLRFIAIITVLFGHSLILVPPSVKAFLKPFVIDGVAVFFVLSGYLIGQILIRIFYRETIGYADLFDFWKRRWMRTLPAYLVVLSLLICATLVFQNRKLPDNLFSYFLFIQNLWNDVPSFFQESWSLSVEEWFYLSIPILLFTVIKSKVFPNKHALFIVLLFIILIPLLYRHLSVSTKLFEDYKLAMQTVLGRIDSIAYGVLIAWVQVYQPTIWNKLTQKNNRIYILLFCITVLLLIAFFHHSDNEPWFVIWIPTIKSLVVAVILPSFTTFKPNTSIFGRFVTQTSLISYSLYLFNRTVVIDYIIKLGIYGEKGRHKLSEFWMVDLIVFWGVSYLLAFISYRYIERTFLRLRDKR